MKSIFIILLTITLTNSCQKKYLNSISLSNTSNSLEVFAQGIISTGLVERDIAISPNHDHIIYTLGNHKQTKRYLVSIQKSKKGWSKPQILSISGRYQDIEPFFTHDGKRLYFASNRPLHKDVKRSDYNIWYSDFKNNQWTPPIALDTIINTKKDEFYPSLSKKGTLYFTATRPDGIGKEDIFYTQMVNGRFQKPKALDSNINSKNYEFNAYINPDETLLIFSSFGRQDGLGGGDLYFSKKDHNGHWSKAQNMGKNINSKQLDFCPFIDQKHGILYFSSERINPNDRIFTTTQNFINHSNSIQNGLSDIYRIPLDKIISTN